MREQAVIQTQKRAKTASPVAGGFFQRKCACGKHTPGGGECEFCRKKRPSLQRQAVDQTGPETTPHIAHEMLRSPGRLLESTSREFMDQHFAHDFSEVQVHSAGQSTKSTHSVQLGLTVSQPGDPYEQEADRVTEQIMHMSTFSLIGKKRDGNHFKPTRQVIPDFGLNTPSNLRQWLGKVGTGRPLADTTRRYMEERFGADFSAVRVHTGESAEHAAALLDARALTYKNHIFLGRGENEANRFLMAHELVHTLQQSGRESNQLPTVGSEQRVSSAISLSQICAPMLQRAIEYPGGTGRGIGDVYDAPWYEADLRLDNIRYIEHSWSHWPNRNCQCDHQIRVTVEEYSTVGFAGALKYYDYYEAYWWNHEFFCTGTPEGSCAVHHHKEGPQSEWRAYDEKGDAPQGSADTLSVIGSIASIAGLIVSLIALKVPITARAEPLAETSEERVA